MDSKTKEILQKFSTQKIDLASEKIELGLKQDVLTIYNALTKVKEKMDDDLAKAKRYAILGDSGVRKFYDKANDIEKMAKELGIPISDINLQKLFSEIKEYEKEFNEVIKL